MGRLRVINGGRNAHPFRLTADERRAIEREVERLIAALDADDGDTDGEEDDHAGDDIDLYGEAPTDDGTRLLAMLPAYGIDQTRGPINHPLAVAGYLAQQEGR